MRKKQWKDLERQKREVQDKSDTASKTVKRFISSEIC